MKTHADQDGTNFIPDEYKRQQGIAMVNAIFDGYGSSEKPAHHPSDPTGKLETTISSPIQPTSMPVGHKEDDRIPDPEYAAIFCALVVAGLLLFLSKVSFETAKYLSFGLVVLICSILGLALGWMILNRSQTTPEDIVLQPTGPGVLPLPIPRIRSKSVCYS